jgi:F-type H+-transporting ATPase subunit epsilon
MPDGAKVAFELVAPERVLARDDVDMVVMPGAEGDFGVLPEHAPFLSLLRPGVITVHDGDRVTGRIFVAGGFAEVNPAGCIVLAEGAEPVDEISPDRARQQLRDAQEDLADTKEPSEAERARLEKAIAVAEARVQAVEGAASAH